MRDGYAMRIATEILNPKPFSIISGHFRKQKTTPLTVIVPKISIVGFGGTTSGEGELPCRKVASMARRCRSCRLSRTSTVVPLLRFLSFQQCCSPSLQNLIADSNPGAQNNKRCEEIAAMSRTRMQLQKVEEWARTICISRTKWRGARRVVLIIIVQLRPLPLASIQCLAMIVVLLTYTN
jgi:hypothetical protein